MIIVGGVLLPTLDPDTRKAFLGLGFDRRGVPLDVLPLYLVGACVDSYTLLIVDEFLRINGVKEFAIEQGQEKLLQTLDAFEALYQLDVTRLFCSEFMHASEYEEHVQRVMQGVQRDDLESLLVHTAPPNRQEQAMEYALHECACVSYLSESGYTCKVGPRREQLYDQVIAALGIPIAFAYVLDAFALGTKSADAVVHYIPTSRGPNNGQRILLSHSESLVKRKLEQGCDDALRYLCSVASVSGHLLGLRSYASEELTKLTGKKLKRLAKKLVVENIVRPYAEVHHG